MIARWLICLMLFVQCAAWVLQGGAAYAGDVVENVESRAFPLERNGVALHLERMQLKGTTPQRQILLVHGLTYSSHEFDVDYEDYSLARYLARQGYAVWRFDVAGYGQSGAVKDGFLPNSDYAAEDAAAAAKAILAASNQAQLDILGWSWGTVTGSRFVARHPEMVRKLVLYAPILVGLGAGEVTSPFNHNTWKHAAGDFQMTPAGDIDYSIVEPGVVATFQSNCWRYDQDSSPNGGRRDLLVAPTVQRIPVEKISVPTLIIGGDKDPYLNLTQMKDSIHRLPQGSHLVIVPGAAHAMMMEKPFYALFRKQVMDFLNK